MTLRRKLLALVALATGISCSYSAGQLLGILFTHYLYYKDFVQIYLMGHALRAGENLYAPIPELAARFDPHLNEWLHLSAYPPAAALIGLPLSYLPYFWAVVTWTTFELCCLSAAVFLIIQHFGGRSASLGVLVTVCVFIGWQPVYLDLYLGQLMLPILLLLTLVWLALKAGKDIRAGLLLGIVFTIKLYAWPIAVFLLFKGRLRRRAVFAAAAVFALSNVLMIGLVGSSTVLDYYNRVGGSVLAEYVNDPFNFSAWSVGFRVSGTIGAVVVLLTVLCYSLFLAFRSNFETGFMIMLTASTILQPISWVHYMITLLPVFCFIADRKDFRAWELAFAVVLIALIIPGFYQAAHTYPAIATFPPFVFAIGLMWLTAARPARETEHHSIVFGC